VDDSLALELKNKFGQDAVLLIGWLVCPPCKSTTSLSEAKESEMLCGSVASRSSCSRSSEPRESAQAACNHPQEIQKGHQSYDMAKIQICHVTCNGLLRCNNQECMQTVVGNHGYWNRVLASFLNCRHILNGLRANGMRPPVFQWPRPPTKKYMILPQ
jgi:hypothetical protein